MKPLPTTAPSLIPTAPSAVSKETPAPTHAEEAATGAHGGETVSRVLPEHDLACLEAGDDRVANSKHLLVLLAELEHGSYIDQSRILDRDLEL